MEARARPVGRSRATARLATLGVARAPTSTRDTRDGLRRLLALIAVGWVLGAIVIDPLMNHGGPWRLIVEVRALGVVAVIGGILAVRQPRCSDRGAWLVLAGTGAVVAALTAVLAAATLGPAHVAGLGGAYDATPAMLLVAVAAMLAPPWRVAAALAATWLVAYVGALLLAGVLDDRLVALIDDPAEQRMMVAALVKQSLMLALAVVVSQRSWRLRHELFESRRLGRYRLMSPLGQGMNEVWLAWDEDRRREVALKLLRTPGAAEETRARFAREAETVRRLHSPHTVRIHDYGVTDDGFAYLAFEYLRGMDLDVLVRGYGRIEAARALYLMRQVCRGLGVAHGAGIVHRDIKPANLHCGDAAGAEDTVHILDFGVARDLDEPTVTRAGTVMGTPAYMSPEAFAGADLTPESDVYAVGATFYSVLTGVPPFDGRTFDELRGAHLRAPVVPPSLRTDADVPRSLEKVILKCLAKDPAHRYRDAIALGAALDACAADVEPWSRDDAARWWHRARVGRVPPVQSTKERTTEVEVVSLRRDTA